MDGGGDSGVCWTTTSASSSVSSSLSELSSSLVTLDDSGGTMGSLTRCCFDPDTFDWEACLFFFFGFFSAYL